MFRKFSPGFSRTVNRLLRSLPGIRHTTATAADPDAATTMEKLDAALNTMSHGLCRPAREHRRRPVNRPQPFRLNRNRTPDF
ncbi:hypothetical protein [Bradyrhizobium sp. URHC0002]